MNENLIKRLKYKLKNKNARIGFFVFIGAIIIVLFSLSNNQQNKNQEINQKIKKNIHGSELAKVSLNNDVEKNKELLKTTNPLVLRDELKKRNKDLNTPGVTSLETKYSNVDSKNQEEIIRIKKEQELTKKNLLEKKQKIAELKQKLEEQAQKEKLKIKNEEISNTQNTFRDRLNKKNIFSNSMDLKLKQQLITEALEENNNLDNKNNSSVKILSYNPKEKTVIEKPIKQINNIKEIRFQIVPGSSFYGSLTNVIYSGYLEPGPILKIEYPAFNNCNFIGKAVQASGKGLAIKLNKVACSDGYEQSINAYAFKMKDLRPVWADEIDHYYMPKAIIGTLSTIINLTKIDLGSNNDNSYASADNSNQKSLVDSILAEELKRYDSEYIMNPQAVVIIFY